VEKDVLVAGALDAASVLVDVLLAMVVAAAVIAALDLGRRWLGPVLRSRRDEPEDRPRDPVSVPSWRPGSEPPSGARPPFVLPPSTRPPSTGGTYGGTRRIVPRFPEDPGRLL
jgi:hypothetical protein